MTTVTINEQQYPIHFGMSVVMSYCKRKGIELKEFESAFAGLSASDVTIESIENIVMFSYEGFKRGAEKSDMKLDFSEADLVDMMVEEDGLIGRILEAYADTLPVNKKKAAAQMKKN